MGGMGTTLQTNNPMVVSQFQTALLRESLLCLALLVLLGFGWNILRAMQLRRAEGLTLVVSEGASDIESPARRLLRLSFGLIWIFDGLLQAQASMPLGLTGGVITPAAAASPSWVQHLVNLGVMIWDDHPVTAAVASVWIQVGIGVLLIVAPRGSWSRVAGAVSVGWGLVVWAFGEAFGDIFGHGLTFLFGAPGAVLVYAFAGLLIALPESAWSSARTGRVVLSILGSFYLAMAVLQAWPGRGFWQGQPTAKSTPGTLTSMVQGMAGTSQPGWLASWVRGFASFDAAHGWAVNFIAVVLLGAIGLAMLVAPRKWLFRAMVVNAIFCLADWILIEDLGFLGGVGTDPNSMIPFVIVCVAGYLALTRPTTAVHEAAPLPIRELLVRRPGYVLRVASALAAVIVVLLGAVPMAVASLRPGADAIVTEAINGLPSAANAPLAAFHLTDQNGKVVTNATLRGKTVAITFLDPVCTTDCPLIAREFAQVDGLLGAASRNVELVAVVANPVYRSTSLLRIFDQREGLGSLPNWLYLTGSLPQLTAIWNDYDVQVASQPAGAMVAHSDVALLVDRFGTVRELIGSNPGQATGALRSSFSGLIASELERFGASS